MTTIQQGSETRQPLSPRDRAAWRRAADELLIAAIFATDYEPLRGRELVAAPVPTAPQPALVAL